MSVELGLSLPAGPPKGQISCWLENLDAILPHLQGHFQSIWMTDHFFWDDEPTYEAWTVLAFAAARWPRFALGPIVLGQSYRNPALTAKMAATLQVLSGGRFIMGIGAGWKEDEYHAYGYPYPRLGVRVEQLAEALEIITRLWTQPGRVTYEGKHYQVVDAYCEPKPDPVPTLLVGGGGTKTTWLAARFANWWNMPDAGFADYCARVQVLHRHCADLGRDPATLRLTWFGRLALGRTLDDALALSRGKWTPRNALAGTPQRVLDQMQPFIDLGVDYFMVEVLGLPDRDIMEMLLDEVVPRLT